MKHLAVVMVAALGAAACSPKSEETNSAQATSPPDTAAKVPTEQAQQVNVMVTGSGYEPATIEAQAGKALTLVFKRTTDEGCGDELVFPGRDIRRQLPLNQEVTVALTPQKPQTISFTCGMGMYKGSIVASAR